MSKTISFLVLTLCGVVFWLLISGYSTQIFIFGLIVSFIVSGIVLRVIYSEKFYKFKFIKFLVLIPLYIIEIMKANIYMIYFILSKRIQPNIKEIKLKTKYKTIQDCIAFMITNLPGSVAISSKNKSFISHSIAFDQNYVKGVKKFESYLLQILGLKNDK
ncbi:MAG: Na+/H+ antiporter subunit E [Candidatus Aenigmarchaeota archaeon]|nr:Na+/H+ antiporter subunit E [Candidatus Aenigmarchaeota archaeon]